MRPLVLALLVVACCVHAPKPAFASRAVQITYETSYRVIVFCDEDVLGFGSATAVASDTLVTARHVVVRECAGALRFVAVAADGTQTIVSVGQVRLRIDIATLVAPTGSFRVWARVARRDVPFGATLHTHVGGIFVPNNIAWSFLYKRLYADGYDVSNGVRCLHLSGSVVAGNSGGGVLNDAGELVGVVVARDVGPDLRGIAVASSQLLFL